MVCKHFTCNTKNLSRFEADGILKLILLFVRLFDLGLTSLSTFFSHIATVSGCGRELNAYF